eukprot:TRINITY_DN82657_c0_g1_i1.p1 TRINITY_DN82657_c0_g1~~TRINITY_DN82657_c0_g1_i1.p1  ORF type:complete len:224 (-),score=62.37 TRINITY_DN82657_c0_g1_i1:264-935(-)
MAWTPSANPSGSWEFAWDAEDGARHNFSHASFKHCRTLFVAAAPFMDGEESDPAMMMMMLTSWIDLLFKCKVKHVVCLASDEDLFGGALKDLGHGDLMTACRGQGLGFHHSPLHEGWPSKEALADALAAVGRFEAKEEGIAVVCRDGKGASAAVAAAWLMLTHDEDAAVACKIVQDAAKDVGAAREPLVAFVPEAGSDMSKLDPSGKAAFFACVQGARELLED